MKQFHISDTLEWCYGTIDITPEYIFEHGEPVYSCNESASPFAAEEIISYGK